jgi:methyltransferase (TIGR00027 family)
MTSETAMQSAETLAALRVAAIYEHRLVDRCEDPFAPYFLGTKLRILTKLKPRSLLPKLLELVAPGSYCFAIARTRHFDEALRTELNAGATQVVIPGAGYDSRAYRMSHVLGKVRVFEVDHPATQQRKRRLLKDAAIEPPATLTYVPADLNRVELAEALADAGFDQSQRTIFLWEGVSYYLPQAAVDAVLRLVACCVGGSSIVFDYAIRSFVEGDTSTHGGKQVAKWLKKIGEPFLFGLPPSDTEAFLAERGLRLVSDLSPEDLEQAYLTTHAGGSLGRTLGHVRVASARVPAMS